MQMPTFFLLSFFFNGEKSNTFAAEFFILCMFPALGNELLDNRQVITKANNPIFRFKFK